MEFLVFQSEFKLTVNKDLVTFTSSYFKIFILLPREDQTEPKTSNPLALKQSKF